MGKLHTIFHHKDCDRGGSKQVGLYSIRAEGRAHPSASQMSKAVSLPERQLGPAVSAAASSGVLSDGQGWMSAFFSCMLVKALRE